MSCPDVAQGTKLLVGLSPLGVHVLLGVCLLHRVGAGGSVGVYLLLIDHFHFLRVLGRHICRVAFGIFSVTSIV